MNTYWVYDKFFNSFDDVVSWAWNTHKILLESEDDGVLTEMMKRDLCESLSLQLSTDRSNELDTY